jgi:predicted amidohydrolase YtcJ
MNKEEIARAVDKAARLELQHIALHCIGDKAIDFAIAMKQRLQKEYPHMVWRFEHFEMPSKQAIHTLATEGGIAVMQPNFSWDVEHYQDRLGERISLINPFRNIQDAKVQFAFGSDDMPSGPLEGIAWACEKAPLEHQRLRRDEAIDAYTAAPAHILQTKRGKIEKGYEANFAVCSSDFTKVEETWIEGKKMMITNTP